MNPDWGIFTQPDTLIQNVYDPQQLNRYMFERGNSLKYEDRDGHSLALAVFVVGAAVTIIGTTLFFMDVYDGTHDQDERINMLGKEAVKNTLTIGAGKSAEVIGKETSTVIDVALDTYENKDHLETSLDILDDDEENEKKRECSDTCSSIIVNSYQQGNMVVNQYYIKSDSSSNKNKNTVKSSSSSNSYWSNFWKKAHEWAAIVKKAFEDHDKKYNSKNNNDENE